MNVYSKIRNKLSLKNRGRISKWIVLLGFKPKVNRKVRSPFQKGIVVFSADFEMAWAFRYSKTKSKIAAETGLRERKNFPTLLSLFDTYKIPVTWATVGHLFLKDCQKDDEGHAHSELPRPGYFENRNWLFNSGDWYDHDPCSDLKKDPAWYASDLIDQIVLSETHHEIGCHTFSHIDLTYENCSKELADAELNACAELASIRGIKLKSMVFPGGTLGNFESLRESGILCYRKPMKFHVDNAYMDNHGLVAIPSSIGLEKDPYGWTKEFHLKMIRRFLKKAIKYKLVCHFWFHPSMDPWYLENVMPEIVKMVGDYRDADKIQALTMDNLAQKVLHHSEKN